MGNITLNKKLNNYKIMKQDICKKLIEDLSKSIRNSINEAFDFGSVNNSKSTGARVTDQARKVV